MDDKLTIRLDRTTLEKARHYAQAKHTDGGRRIENHLATLIAPSTNEEEVDISHFVRSLASKARSSGTGNAKQVCREHLYRKYR